MSSSGTAATSTPTAAAAAGESNKAAYYYGELIKKASTTSSASGNKTTPPPPTKTTTAAAKALVYENNNTYDHVEGEVLLAEVEETNNTTASTLPDFALIHSSKKTTIIRTGATAAVVASEEDNNCSANIAEDGRGKEEDNEEEEEEYNKYELVVDTTTTTDSSSRWERRRRTHTDEQEETNNHNASNNNSQQRVYNCRPHHQPRTAAAAAPAAGQPHNNGNSSDRSAAVLLSDNSSGSSSSNSRNNFITDSCLIGNNTGGKGGRTTELNGSCLYQHPTVADDGDGDVEDYRPQSTTLFEKRSRLPLDTKQFSSSTATAHLSPSNTFESVDKIDNIVTNASTLSSDNSSAASVQQQLRHRLAYNQHLYGIATLGNRYQFANPLLDIEPDTRDPRNGTESLPRGLQGLRHKKSSGHKFWANKAAGAGNNIYQRSLSIFTNGVSPLLRKKKTNKHTAAADEEVYQAGGLKNVARTLGRPTLLEQQLQLQQQQQQQQQRTTTDNSIYSFGLSRSRRTSEPIMFSYDSITNELSKFQAREERIVENINLDLEKMLMADAGGPGANVGGANGSDFNHAILNHHQQQQQHQQHHSIVGGAGSSAVSPSSSGGGAGGANNITELNTAAALRHQLKLATMQYNQQQQLRSNKDMETYGRAMSQQQQQQQQQQPISYKEPFYMCYDETMGGGRPKGLGAAAATSVVTSTPSGPNHYNQSGLHNDDNIYEEIDFLTIASLRAQYADTLSLQSYKNNKKGGSKRSLASSSFTRWFSTRKKASPSMSEDENPYIDIKITKKQRPPIMLPEAPLDLTKEQMKRRYIIGSIVDSENSYINSLQRIINCYKKPLEDGSGTILSTNKINIIFHRLEQILQCHTIFGIALSQCVREWDEKETIGDVFIASFSKSMVLDIYSDFINNFTNAMETARKAAKSKSAFAQFLQAKSLSSPDRLSFFGLMVKPVQRFPQFILLLTDLLKHTPADHHDRMSLQLALTQLESLADRLNERKRDAERHFAVRQLLKDYLSSSTTSSSHRFLLRQDDVYQLDLDTGSGVVLKTKLRKLYLLNDMLVCVSVPANRLKFAVSLLDVDVMDEVKPATANLVANAVLKKDPASASTSPKHCTVERMYCDLNSLLHDLEVLSRITNLISSLRYQYNGLSVELTAQIRDEIREEIRKKDAQITLIDKSCLQVRIRSKNYKDIICIQMADPEVKKDWLTDVRLARLALDRANNPAWDIVNESLTTSRTNLSNSIVVHRVPLFVKSLPIFATTEHSQLTCALYYNLYRRNDLIFENKAGVLWICNVNENGSQLGALATNGADLSLIHSYELCDSHVTCIESVGSYAVWIGLRQGRIIVIDASSPGEWQQFATLDVAAEVVCIRFFGHFVFVGLVTGVVALFNATHYEDPIIIKLAAGCPVTCLLPVNKEMFACCGDKIWCIKEAKLDRSYSLYSNGSGVGLGGGLAGSSTKVSPDMSPEIKSFAPSGGEDADRRPNLLAHCGIGLWVSLVNSSIIKLYHTETFKHLQDVNVASNVKRVLNEAGVGAGPAAAAAAAAAADPIGGIYITSMLATRGLLWVGTNVGVIVTLNLPRLQGVPLVSGCLNVALHRHTGPVTVLLSLTASSQNDIPAHPNNLVNSVGGAGGGSTSGAANDKTKVQEGQMMLNGLDSEALGEANELKQDAESIYGLYSDLMNVENYVRSGHESRQSNTIGPCGVSGAGVGPLNKMTWDLANINLSDDSTSESAIYQEGGGILRKRVAGAGPSSLAATLQGRQLANVFHHQQQQQQMSPAKSQSSIYDTGSMAIGGAGGGGGVEKDISTSSGLGASSSLYDIAPGGRIVGGGSRYELNTAAATSSAGGGSRIYDTNGVGSLAGTGSGSAAPKTALLLTGGNGYKRVTLTDAPTVSQHAHCCIWEYKL